jgi:hypothetical protein
MTRPNFRPVSAPLDASDADLEKLNERLRVPTMVKSPAEMPAVRENLHQDAPKDEPLPSPTRRSSAAKKAAPAPDPVQEAIRLSVMVPAYLSDAVNLRAAQERSTLRHIVMQALANFGFEIDPADLVPDGRRPGKKRRS